VYEKGRLDLRAVLDAALSMSSDGSVGAVAFFFGVAKRKGSGEKDVMLLEMESYVEHANRAIQTICDETRDQNGLRFVGIWHLVGKFELGEPVVLVVAAGVSRDPVFKGLREAVERYKREPALFKKEVYVNGSHAWVEGA